MTPLSTTMKTYTVSFARVTECLIDTELTLEKVACLQWLEEFHEGWPDIAITIVGCSSFGQVTDEEMEFDIAVMLRPEDYELVKEDFDFAENVPPDPITLQLHGLPSDFKKIIGELIDTGEINPDQDHPLANLILKIEGQLNPQADRTLDFIDLAEIFKE